MRRFCFIIITFLTFSCSRTDKSTKTNDTEIDTAELKPMLENKSKENDTETTTQYSECDSLKVMDYKTNIQPVLIGNETELLISVDKMAKDYIRGECENDDLYCDDIVLRERKYFKSDLNDSLFQFGYRFKNAETGMEDASSSFFVFGIIRNGKIQKYDIVSDLMGEIQLKLAGIEMKNKEIMIWGEMYPYFSPDDYGQFKLTFTEDRKDYEFKCKSQGH